MSDKPTVVMGQGTKIGICALASALVSGSITMVFHLPLGSGIALGCVCGLVAGYLAFKWGQE